tara:strand:- start:140 stop:1084 length:945 start_codon:yes stop_codon:yes gene_type:complete
MARLTEEQKLHIIDLDKAGLSGRKIEAETGVPRSTVGDFLRRESYQSWWEEYDKCNDESFDLGQKIATDKEERSIHGKDTGGEDNSRILLISDMHIPYHHPDTLPFLQYLKDKYQPTRVICLGDELDKHALSYHDSDPDLKSAGDELRAALPTISELEKMFPTMDIIDSNHGSLVWRKAKTHGIPRHYIKSYNQVLEVGDGWKWHNDMTIDLPNGNKCYLHHGKSNNVTRVSQTMGMCTVQGHFHEIFKTEYWGNPNGLYWALQCGCLIDDESYAFSYNNVNLKRPVIGTGLIINSMPILEPMVLDSEGRWVGM